MAIARLNNTKTYVPDIIFPTNNEFEIPSLLIDVQPQGCEIPFVCFGEQSRQHECVYVSSIITLKNKVKSLENQLKQIALPTFSDFQNVDIAKELEEYRKDLFGNQVENFNQKQIEQ